MLVIFGIGRIKKASADSRGRVSGAQPCCSSSNSPERFRTRGNMQPGTEWKKQRHTAHGLLEGTAALGWGRGKDRKEWRVPPYLLYLCSYFLIRQPRCCLPSTLIFLTTSLGNSPKQEQRKEGSFLLSPQCILGSVVPSTQQIEGSKQSDLGQKCPPPL